MLWWGFYFLHTQQIISGSSSQEVQACLEDERAGLRGSRKDQFFHSWQGGPGKKAIRDQNCKDYSGWSKVEGHMLKPWRVCPNGSSNWGGSQTSVKNQPRGQSGCIKSNTLKVCKSSLQ